MKVTKEIVLILRKSERKNSKAKYIYFTKVDEEKYTISELREILSIIIANKKDFPNIYFRFNSFLSQKRYSFEQNINDLFNIMQYENKENFDMNREDLHRNENIRYLIKKYYE